MAGDLSDDFTLSCMTPAILFAILFAFAAGAATGFRRRWVESLLLSAIAVPFVASVIFAVRLDPLSFMWGWALLTFFWSVICAFIVWGVAAGAHHAVALLRGKLTKRSRGTPASGRPLT
jgi:hypothetical protein